MPGIVSLPPWKNGITYCFKKIQMQHLYIVYVYIHIHTNAFYTFLFSQTGFPKATAAGLRSNIRNTDKRSGAHLCFRKERDVQPILKIVFWPQGHPCSLLTKNLFLHHENYSIYFFVTSDSSVCEGTVSNYPLHVTPSESLTLQYHRKLVFG